MPDAHTHPLITIGVMSGTSADGIDIAIVRLHGGGKIQLLAFDEHPMPSELREPILRLAEPGLNEIDALGELDSALGKAIARAVLQSLDTAGIAAASVAAIGSHGQTIRHRPSANPPFSLQIGCPSTIAEITGITTVADFRRRDIAAGGQGAPLTPLAHRLLFGDRQQAMAVLNIGGIANISYLDPSGRTLGFDTGPGNMLMDGLMLALSDGRDAFDQGGRLAASGKVCNALLETLLQHPFFARPAPKSTGREEFGHKVVEQILAWQGVSDADRMATAAHLTAASIAHAQRLLPAEPSCWYVCGGGAYNEYLMHLLADLLAPARVTTTEHIGIPSNAVEATSFALFGWLALAGLSNTIPEVTGADHAVSAGHIAPGRNWPELTKLLTRNPWTPSPMP
ncbi:MAG: anhydro-N-acetylmuramic acid kinase [Mariprofundaceae bacterium]